jgi:hypothetical protein
MTFTAAELAACRHLDRDSCSTRNALFCPRYIRAGRGTLGGGGDAFQLLRNAVPYFNNG